MTSKLRNVLLFAFFVVFATSVLGFAFTSARYAGELSPDNRTGELEYTVVNQVEIATVDQFFAAIENGYSNIRIADGVDNPFLVTGSADVTADLILDLNGHDIQRNNREPMLTIKEGVKMIVTDTSETKSGSFYNPVGSVLKIEGGVLTVMEGKFESGVRLTEYSDSLSSTRGTIEKAETLTVHNKNTDGSGYAEEDTLLPIIVPSVTKAETGAPDGDYHYYVNGNLYLDKKLESYPTDHVAADTYFYFTLKENDAMVTADTILPSKGSADFYYTYYLNKSTGDENKPVYTYGENTGEQIEVTVYGYRDVIASASNAEGTGYDVVPGNFAAIQMKSGSLYTRGGNYYSYFGVGSAYCVYAEGGAMTVLDGNYEAIKKGVCISCSFGADGGSLNVVDGAFTSQSGDTVQMRSGSMSVAGGRFIKDATDSAETADRSNGAAIHVSGNTSELSVTGSEDAKIPFTMIGSGLCAIDCSDGASLTAEYVGFTVDKKNGGFGKNNAGIYNDGGKITVKGCGFDIGSETSVGIVSTGERGSVSVSSTEFKLDGASSKGIYQLDGVTTVDSGIFSMEGTGAIGVLASKGIVNIGSLPKSGYGTDNSVFFYIDHIENCYGILAGLNTSEEDSTGSADDSSAVTVNLLSAQFYIGQGTAGPETSPKHYYELENDSKPDTDSGINCAGIFSNLRNASINVTRGVFLVAGSYSAGIYAEKGTIDSSSDSDSHKLAVFAGVQYQGYVNGGYKEDTGWIYSKWDEESYRQGTEFGALSPTKASGSYGIASLGGSIVLNDIYIYLKSLEASALYSYGGEVKLSSFDADVTDENQSYLSTSVLSVRSGSVEIGDCAVWTNGIGLTVEGGSFTIGGTANIVSTRSTAIYLESKVGGSRIHFTSGADVTVNCTIVDRGTAVSGKASGVSIPWRFVDTQSGNFREVSHYDGIKINGGSFISEGSLRIVHAGLANDTGYSTIKDYVVKSFAIRVTGDDSTEATVQKAVIGNSCGGGISVSGGKTVLGYEGIASDGLRVSTTGKNYATNNGEKFTEAGFAGNWSYYKSTSGGHAVSSDGGSLTVYGGTYQAAFGDGVYVKKGNVTINRGSFIGNNKDTQAGIAASYGFKMYGGSVTINGGEFGNEDAVNSNCAMIMGTGSDNRATALINSGRFVSPSANAAFCIFDYSDVTFGEHTGDNGAIDVMASTAALTIEGISGVGGDVSVKINKGIFRTLNLDSDWSNAVYHAYSAAKLEINGGILIGIGGAAIGFYSTSVKAYTTVNGGILIGAIAPIRNGEFTAPLTPKTETLTPQTVKDTYYGDVDGGGTPKVSCTCWTFGG